MTFAINIIHVIVHIFLYSILNNGLIFKKKLGNLTVGSQKSGQDLLFHCNRGLCVN